MRLGLVFLIVGVAGGLVVIAAVLLQMIRDSRAHNVCRTVAHDAAG